MAKPLLKKTKSSGLSQLLIASAVFVILIASYESITHIDITSLAPTQLYLAAAVLGILGLYTKDER